MFYGWYIVGCAFVVAVCGWGFGFYGPGVYLASLRTLYGWPTALGTLTGGNTTTTFFYPAAREFSMYGLSLS